MVAGSRDPVEYTAGDLQLEARQPLPADVLRWMRDRGRVSLVTEVDTMLATPSGDFQLCGHLRHSLIENCQGIGFDQVCPPDQGGVIGYIVEVHPAKLPQDQTVSNLILRLLVAQAIQLLDRQHSQDHFYWS